MLQKIKEIKDKVESIIWLIGAFASLLVVYSLAFNVPYEKIAEKYKEIFIIIIVVTFAINYLIKLIFPNNKHIVDMFENSGFDKIEYYKFVRYTHKIDDFDAARIWLEHLLLAPRLNEKDETKRRSRDEENRSNITRTINMARKNKKSKSDTTYATTLITVADCTCITENVEKIHKYLSFIERHYGVSDEINKDNRKKYEKIKFISYVQVQKSYLSPRFLLHGIMSAFGDEWGPVVNKYGVDVNEPFDGRTADFEAFRIFQFNCWVIWGPSVPVCTCERWEPSQQGTVSLQYGFGDENNSIDVLFNKKFELSKKLEDEFSKNAAVNYSICGVLRSPDSALLHVGKSQRSVFSQSVRADAEPDPSRLLLEVTEGSEAVCAKTWEVEALSDRHYFSAYIWIMFLLAPRPVRPDEVATSSDSRPKEGSWRDLLPFFVHGNVVDRDMQLTYKTMLIEQVAGQLADLLERYDINLRYECAFDDSSEGSALLRYGERHTETLRSLLQDAIKRDVTLLQMQERGRLIVPRVAHSTESSRAAHEANPYSTCRLPEILGAYYEHLDTESKNTNA